MLATWWVWPTFSASVISVRRRSTRSSTGSAASSHGRSGVGGVAVTSVMSVGLHDDLGGGLGGGGQQVGGPNGHARPAVGVGEGAQLELAPAHDDPAHAVALGSDDVADRQVAALEWQPRGELARAVRRGRQHRVDLDVVAALTDAE